MARSKVISNLWDKSFFLVPCKLITKLVMSTVYSNQILLNVLLSACKGIISSDQKCVCLNYIFIYIYIYKDGNGIKERGEKKHLSLNYLKASVL